jgi:hypothetical protein
MDETSNFRARQTNSPGKKRGFCFASKINHLAMIDFVGTSICRGNSE